MIRVRIPLSFRTERSYVVDTVLGDFLELRYELISEERSDYLVEFENGSCIQFADCFWSLTTEQQGYLHSHFLPLSPPLFYTSQWTDFSLPVLYGSAEIHTEDKRVHCRIDVFASIFFMLTRWEEVVVSAKDQHGRFDENAAWVVRSNLFLRPIVDEYVELISNLVRHLDPGISLKKNKTEVILTCDVDMPFFWKNPGSFLKFLSLSLMGSTHYKPYVTTWKNYFQSLNNKSLDPFAGGFEVLMDLAEQGNIPLYFFLKSTSRRTTHDYPYSLRSKRFQKILCSPIRYRK